MKKLLIIALCVLAFPPGFLAITPAHAAARPVVVELFTSQGCSSCPPADAYLGELAARDNVIALSWPVTYLDYLGWKDTLAQPAFTRRQKTYAKQLNLKQVFTPQMVIGGAVSAVGSSRADVEQALTAQANRPGPDIIVMQQYENVIITVESGPPARAKVLLLSATRAVNVPIGRGENAGRTISYHNVVRNIRELGPYDGSSALLPVRDNKIHYPGADLYIVLVQDTNTGRILAATQFRF